MRKATRKLKKKGSVLGATESVESVLKGFFLMPKANPITYQLYNGPLYMDPPDFITP